MKRISIATIFFLLFFHGFAQEPKITSTIKKAMEGIDTLEYKAHIVFLADDALRGRAPGTEGYKMAVDYVSEEFKKMGVLPAGDNGGYTQKFNLRRSSIEAGSQKIILGDNKGNTDSVFRNDLIVSPHPLKTSVEIKNAPLVFAGYGVDIPGKHSDYQNIDVKGKIVVVLRTTPEGLSSTYSAHFANVGYKMALARSKGAIGMIVASPTPGPMPLAGGTLNNAMNPEKTEAYGSRYVGNVDVFITASNNFLRTLFLNSGKSLDEILAALKKGQSQAFEFNKTLSVQFRSKHADIETWNVVGLIPGTDAKLKNEYVVHTAHLDHVGVGRPVDGDSIYNGAHDNASGVASLLEIARLYKKSGVKPKRSILITMVSAEESGLLGSAYFASNPTIPKTSIVGNVNTDMPTIIAPLLSIVPLGAAHSTMAKYVNFAAKALKLDIEEDPEPEQNFFVRSDQYSFVKEHIPAVNCKYGSKSNIPGFNLREYIKQWRAKYYHKPQDQLDGGVFLYSAAQTYIQLNFLISYSVSMDKERPRWNDGELF
jgi:hypothetical protein